MTWYVEETAWRVELAAARWSLSRNVTATETWQRVGSNPNRQAAIEAAYSHRGGTP
jgi:hypothetical protein